MKVSEAKEKVCPFSIQYGRVPSSKDVGGFGLHKGDMLASKCICGDCMAWKFTKKTSFKKIPYNPYDYNEAEEITVDGLWYYLHEDADYYISEDFDLKENAEGYCARIGTC